MTRGKLSKQFLRNTDERVLGITAHFASLSSYIWHRDILFEVHWGGGGEMENTYRILGTKVMGVKKEAGC